MSKKRAWYVAAVAANGSEKSVTDNLDEDAARAALAHFEQSQSLEDLSNGGSYALRATYFPPKPQERAQRAAHVCLRPFFHRDGCNCGGGL